MRNPAARSRVPAAMRPSRLAPVLLALPILLAGCGIVHNPFPPPTEPVDPRVPSAAPPDPQAQAQVGQLRAALAAWESSAIDSYTWKLAVLCECSPSGPIEVTVVDGTPTKVVSPQGERDLAELEGFPLTVDAVLKEAIDAIDGGGKVEVEWAARPGLPASITIDRMPSAIDDELILEVTGLDPAP